MNHIRMKYGKYLNKIDTEIPIEHILVDKVGEVSRSVEPGEPNLPSPESYTIQLANLAPDGSERYPLSFWQNASRQEEEGATQELQLYVQIFIDDQPQFTGILKRVRYALYDTVCSLELRDITDLLKTEERVMLKSFEFTIPYQSLPTEYNIGIQIDAPGVGFNDLPELTALSGETIPHETLTFQLFVAGWRGGRRRGEDGPDNIVSGKFDPVSEDGSPVYPFAHHFGWEDLEFVTPVSDNNDMVLGEDVRPAYVQIDDITLFTRCRFWVRQVSRDIGGYQRIRQEFMISIWHNASVPEGGIIPQGRFLSDNELITSETEEMEVIIHEPNLGHDDDVAITAGLLPTDENFIFGLPYREIESVIELSSDEYAYFDVMEKTREIINADISIRHTDQGLSGSLEITGFDPNANAGDSATAFMEVRYAPNETKRYKIVIEKPGAPAFRNTESRPFTFNNGDSYGAFLSLIQTSILAGTTRVFWNPLIHPTGVEIVAKETGSYWDDFKVLLFEDLGDGYWKAVFPHNIVQPISTSGGETGGFTSEPIDFKIGGEVFATTSNIEDTDTLADIAERVYDAAVAVGDPDLEFALDGERVDVVSYRGAIEALTLDVGDTNIEYESTPLSGSLDIFDISRLTDVNRLAFYSDAIMFGWLGDTVIESLVAVGWQTSSQIFTTAEGKIAFHSRTFYETFPNDINSPEFLATFIEDAAWEPASGNTYDEGFSSYEAEVFQDIIEVSNLTSNEKKRIFADKDGARSRPSLNNKKVRLGNYRTHDLGVSFQGVIYRYSPADDIWIGEPLSRFLPTAQEQLNILARTFPFPITATKLKIFWPDYQDVDVGGYIWGQDSELWLVKNISLNPRSLVATLDIEFKKELVDYGQSFDEAVGLGDIVLFQQIIREEYVETIPVGEQQGHSHDVSEGVDVEELDEITVREQYIEGVEADEDWNETVTPPET